MTCGCMSWLPLWLIIKLRGPEEECLEALRGRTSSVRKFRNLIVIDLLTNEVEREQKAKRQGQIDKGNPPI